jgi:hypothetical protein
MQVLERFASLAWVKEAATRASFDAQNFQGVEVECQECLPAASHFEINIAAQTPQLSKSESLLY